MSLTELYNPVVSLIFEIQNLAARQTGDKMNSADNNSPFDFHFKVHINGVVCCTEELFKDYEM